LVKRYVNARADRGGRHQRRGWQSKKLPFGPVYAGTIVATVKLPTQPAAEFTVAGGIRPKIANIDFDLGMTYFAYPGERLPGEMSVSCQNRLPKCSQGRRRAKWIAAARGVP